MAVWGTSSPLALQTPEGDVDARQATDRVRFTRLGLWHLYAEQGLSQQA